MNQVMSWICLICLSFLCLQVMIYICKDTLNIFNKVTNKKKTKNRNVVTASNTYDYKNKIAK